MKILRKFCLVLIVAVLSIGSTEAKTDAIQNSEIKESMLTNLSLYPLKKGIYQHYRNKKYYEVLGVGRHSENLEPVVVYRALYEDFDLWVRPYNMFVEKVQDGEQKCPRFEYISDQTSEEFLKNLNK